MKLCIHLLFSNVINTLNYHFNFHSLFKPLCARFYVQNRVHVTIYHLSLAWSLLVYKCTWNQVKLFVACPSCRILKHRLNHIFHCRLLRILESFQDTSKIPTFTLLIKNYAHFHSKMLNCNFYVLKSLRDFRYIANSSSCEKI